MARLRLNDKTVRGLSVDADQSYREVWDTILPGFGVRVFPSGRRTWFVRYRTGGRQVRRRLGRYPQMGVGEARELARERMGGRRMSVAGSLTVADLVEQYREIHVPRKRAASQVEDERILRKDVLPSMGGSRLAEVGVAEVAAVIDGVARRGAPIMANRTRALLSKLWAFGMARGLVASNPVTATERPGVERPRERVLSEEELGVLWGVWEAEASVMSTLFQLLVLTGQRSGETKSMAWDEIEGQEWVIPSAKAKNGRATVVPLSALAQRLLGRLRRDGGERSAFVFPSGGKTGHLTTLSRATERYRKQAGVEDWTPHDLRRTVTTRLAERGAPPHVLDALLNHVPTGVTARVYNRYQYVDEVREALVGWGQYVEGLASES